MVLGHSSLRCVVPVLLLLLLFLLLVEFVLPPGVTIVALLLRCSLVFVIHRFVTFVLFVVIVERFCCAGFPFPFGFRAVGALPHCTSRTVFYRSDFFSATPLLCCCYRHSAFMVFYHELFVFLLLSARPPCLPLLPAPPCLCPAHSSCHELSWYEHGDGVHGDGVRPFFCCGVHFLLYESIYFGHFCHGIIC